MRFFILLLLLWLAGCATNPVSGRKDFVTMSESQEVAVGRQNDAQVRKEYKVYENPALQDYVNRVGQKLAKQSHRPGLTYHFTVLDSPEINAFALPGGYIYITRGILAYLNNEAELAAVLGHELGHVTARHGVRQQSAAQVTGLGLILAAARIPGMDSKGGQELGNLVGGALLSGYGRDHELEADKLGAEYLARAQYDPQAIINVIRVLKNQELLDVELAKQEGREPRRYHGLFATHPDNDKRLQQAVGEAGKQKVSHPIVGQQEFLALTDGMVFGDSADQGLVRNNRFYHSELGIVLQFPVGWRVNNMAESVLAIAPSGEYAVEMRLGVPPNGLGVSEYARQLSAGRAQVKRMEVNDLPAALIESGDALAAVLFFGDQAMIIQAKAKSAAALRSAREPFLAVFDSFHQMTARERRQVKPWHIRLIKAGSGTTFAKLAQSSPLEKNAESYLRLINARYPNGEPEAGQPVKVIE